jgi:hypothetical protein
MLREIIATLKARPAATLLLAGGFAGVGVLVGRRSTGTRPPPSRR